jgi:hypothetical protein
MNRIVLAGAVAGVCIATLTACGSDSGASVATPSPTPTPTPSSVIWAGDVCVARDNLKAAVAALGHNLSYDVTSDRSAIEQIDRQLRIQVLSVADAAGKVGTALKGVPVDFAAANDLIVTVDKARTDTSEAVTAVTTSLDAALSADSIISGVAEAGKALVAAKAAFESGQVLVSTVVDATTNATGELGDAFDAAPECQGDAG